MNIREAIIGTVITVVIGGTAYTINQADVVNNFAEDTGLTQEQAEQYVKEIKEEDLASWKEIGISYIDDGEGIVKAAAEFDCVNYTYDWESSSLSCPKGKEQVSKLGNDSILLGQAYVKLDSDSASKEDIKTAIELIDILNADYDLDVVKSFLSAEEIVETKNTTLYNKAVLKAVLESE